MCAKPAFNVLRRMQKTNRECVYFGNFPVAMSGARACAAASTSSFCDSQNHYTQHSDALCESMERKLGMESASKWAREALFETYRKHGKDDPRTASAFMDWLLALRQEGPSFRRFLFWLGSSRLNWVKGVLGKEHPITLRALGVVARAARDLEEDDGEWKELRERAKLVGTACLAFAETTPTSLRDEYPDAYQEALRDADPWTEDWSRRRRRGKGERGKGERE